MRHEKAPRRFHARRLELIAAGVLGLLTLTAYLLQWFTASPQTSGSETALFNSLQFLLTLGFTWFGTRAISKAQFEDSLRRFAIGAYRRVTDIQRMIRRLDTEVGQMIEAGTAGKEANLRIVRAMVQDTEHVVESSIADWGDVIGEELLAMEKIRRLEDRREELASGMDETAGLRNGQDREPEQVQRRIEELLDSLPADLQLEARTDAMERRRSEHAAEWFRRRHYKEDGLVLPCVTGDDYLSERAASEVAPGERVLIKRNENGALDVYDLEGRGVGRVQNIAPLPYFEFVDAVHECYGGGPIICRFLEHKDGEQRVDGYYEWFRIEVLLDPESGDTEGVDS